MANAESNFSKEMSDNLALARTLAHHDAAISGLGMRMTGVETGLSHVNEKVSTLDSRVAQGFGEVLSQIREGKASRGPGLLDSVKMAGGIITICGALVLVVSFINAAMMAPQLKQVDQLSEFRARDEEDRRREFNRLREEQKNKVDGTLDKIAEQLEALQLKSGWGVVTIEKGPRK